MERGGFEAKGLNIGMTITDGVEDAIEEACALIGGQHKEVEQAYVSGLLRRTLKGEIGIFTLLRHGRAVGAIFYKLLECEAEFLFGYVIEKHSGMEGPFLKSVIKALSAMNIFIVRSGFSWPRSGQFIKAALDLGFIEIERMSMARDTSIKCPVENHLPDNVQLLPLTPEHFEDISRIMYEEAVPADRLVYPLFASQKGCESMLRSIINNKHGTFMPELSAVASLDGSIIGILITSVLIDGSVLVLDIAVSKQYRKLGIGRSLLELLINKCNILGFRQVVLAVTGANSDAIALYEKMGFKVNSMFRQFVLIERVG
jgi:ribosomal protein S18 acetylase RimI-like enzyme